MEKSPPDVLYHYCSTEAFHAILESKTIWLSSLTASNDGMEGINIIERLINELVGQQELNEQARWNLEYTFLWYERFMEGLGFCLSENGDLLSQWRGYSSDGSGVSIGFSAQYLQSLAKSISDRGKSGVFLQKVEYEPEGHKLLVDPIYQKIKPRLANNIERRPFIKENTQINTRNPVIKRQHDGIMFAKFALLDRGIDEILFRLKPSVFREEREWRLLNISNRGPSTYMYRIRHNRIIPYLKFDLDELKQPSIVEVILGPKHNTPIDVVEKFIEQHGYQATRLKRSDASYV